MDVVVCSFLYWSMRMSFCFFFFFNDTATTEIYTLSLHDALPICRRERGGSGCARSGRSRPSRIRRSEEHTSELQSLRHLVCRLLLEKKKKFYGHGRIKRRKKKIIVRTDQGAAKLSRFFYCRSSLENVCK